jgi:hypothetical protein
MDVDEDDDFYAPAEDMPSSNQDQQMPLSAESKPDPRDDDLEEGEEEDEGEDEGSDSVRSTRHYFEERSLIRI